MNLQNATIAILGSGTMGYGIAQVCASAGHRVQLFDVQASALERALKNIETLTAKAVEKGKLTAIDRLALLQRIQATTELQSIRADLIIEAVPELLALKQELFQTLEPLQSPGAVFATNTSSLSVTSIAQSLNRPERCIGLHFFNPAPLMKLVEVIAGEATDPALVAETMSFVHHLGKSPALVRDIPGFIVNRVARFYYLEALRIVHSGVANHESIDRLMEGIGFRMGPFRLMDLIGIDTNHSVTQAIYNSYFQEPRFRPNLVQQKKVEAGQWGVKTRKGFYDYPEDR